MFLKKIIISGFKSFADKIVVTLDKGITGVVGPNGSGKSNIIDAVRWVMGEQNAKNLRGEKATDIIFAGSERRKALGMAEVSLVFDNSDDSAFCPPEYRHEPEITLTRRLYADGQREYLINRKPCRLKDIIGFFATTGLGGRSYSMIQQGQVDRILNAKPEDVREILEEAAGTMVYKKRKAEAEKKLGDTQLNLSRIEDILQEVERTLTSLEDQVEKAKEYQELSDKLREDEVSLFAHNFKHFKDEQDKIKEKLDAETAQEAEALAQMATFEARHAELQGQLDDADPEIQELQEKITVVREKIARAESTLKSAIDRIENGGRRLRDISEELAEDDANLKVLESQVDAARRELDGAEGVARELKEAIETFEYEVEAATEAAQVYQGRMDEFEDEIRNLERLLESNKFRTEQLEKDFARTKAEQAEEEARLALAKSEIGGVTEELAAAEKRAGATKAGLDQEIRDKHAREAAVAQAYQQMKDANARRDKQREKYHEVRGRFTSLQEIDAGATDVAGAVNKLKTEDPDAAALVKGLLADWIAFGEAAAELPKMAAGAFERWAERVVVEDLAAFNDLVRAAHRHGVGTLPVAVLSRVEKVDAAAAAAWAEKFGAEPLKTYLKVEDGLPGIENVLDRLYLLPALALDDDVLAEVPRGVLVFTSQGVMFAGDDELVIGSKSAGGLLSRKTELEALAKDLKVLEGELSRAQTEIDELELKINEDRQLIAEIDAKYRAQSDEVLEVMTAYQTIKQQFDRKNELILSAEAALAKLNATEERLASEREELTKNRFSLSREHANAKAELTNIQGEAESLVDRREEIRRLHDGKRIDLAKSEARAQALRDGFLTAKAQLELLQNKLSRRYEERSRLEQDSEVAKREQVQAKADIEASVHERDELQNIFASKREANAGIIEEVRVIDNKLRGLRETHGSLQRGLAEKNVHMERLRMALAGVTEQATEKYHLDLAAYTASDAFALDPDFNHDGKQRSVSRLRNKIEGMGAINMMALKEFEEKSERRDFIVKQRDEVLSAIDLLMTAISEIEETSLRKFLEVFTRINAEFGMLFPILFPTGEGKLEMDKPDNPLESGIEILCRLPGKSQKPMSLFSGGEKALTAMALIFALLKTKPTPYCFLDEVDAPLDEANVGRYNRVLEALSGQFQFIVITHNRRTMEVLDTLYGITMQEPGVSKVVGVDMQKDLPPHLRKAFKDEKALAGAGQPAAVPPAPERVGATVS
jgi:chromosome segregation protein